jgi:hypothetical protein
MSRLFWVLRAFVILACLSVPPAGCKADKPTQIVVSIDTNLTIPDEIDLLVVKTDYQGKNKSYNEYDLASPKDPDFKLPSTLTLVAGSDPAEPVLITVTGQKGKKRVVERKARLTWVPGKILLLRITLLRSCANLFCEDAADQTCIDGSCAGVDVGAEKLPEYSDDQAFKALDGGGQDLLRDQGTLDGPIDVSHSDVPVDGSMRDTGVLDGLADGYMTDVPVVDAPPDSTPPDTNLPDVTLQDIPSLETSFDFGADMVSDTSSTVVLTDDFDSGQLNKWTVGGRQEGVNVAEVVYKDGSNRAHLYHEDFSEITLQNVFQYDPNLSFAFEMQTSVASQASSTSSFYAKAGVRFFFLDSSGQALGMVGYIRTTSSFALTAYNPAPENEYIEILDDKNHSYNLAVAGLLSRITINTALITSVKIEFSPHCSGWPYNMSAELWLDNVVVTK